MAYTYQLRFSTGAYAELLPTNQIELEGLWETGTMIWREKIGEVKIGRLLNPTIYNTLDTWFNDNTKFSTRINIKILLDGVEESVHWFGVKWGFIDEYQKTYTVQPILYDNWGQYFESIKGVIDPTLTTTALAYRYYDQTGTYAYVNVMGTSTATLEDAVKEIPQSSWSTANVVSSFLWQDAYEDASSVGTYRGMPLDYVTGKGSFLTFASIIAGYNKSFSDVLEWLKLLRVYVFFDSNNKLRYEHIKFFNDKLFDNAVDYSALIKGSDDKWSYENTSIPTRENVSMKEESDNIDEDFEPIDIIYSDIRNRPDVQDYEFISPLFADIGYIATNITDDFSFAAGILNQTHKFFNIDMTTFSADSNYLAITASSSGLFCGSSDIKIFASQVYQFEAIGTLTGSFDVYFEKRDGTLLSNTANLTAITSTTITTTGAADDAFIKIESRATPSSWTGWITITKVGEVMIPTIDAIISGNPKTNGAFSVGNIIDSWWQDDRLARDATFNSGAVTFDGTIFNLRRDTINVYPSAIPNPLFGWSDGTRIAKIEKWIRNLKTGYYNIDLVYQEDAAAYNFSLWNLPSHDTLEEMYTALHVEGVGGFASSPYWSSTENNATSANALYFDTGIWTLNNGKNSPMRVRACRSFTAAIGLYSLRDTGPGGGLIFYISGTTYYEENGSDLSTSQVWSNIDTVLIGATAQGSAIGDGVTNTAAIIGQVGHTASAAKLCNDLN